MTMQEVNYALSVLFTDWFASRGFEAALKRDLASNPKLHRIRIEEDKAAVEKWANERLMSTLKQDFPSINIGLRPYAYGVRVFVSDGEFVFTPFLEAKQP